MAQECILKAFLFLDCVSCALLKVQYVVLGKTFESEETELHWLNILYAQTNLMNKLSLFSQLNKLNKQAELKGQHSVLLFIFVYMWRTLPPF